MIKIGTNTERFLADKIAQWQFENTGLRCLSLKFSQIEDKDHTREFIDKVFIALDELLADHDAMFYIFDDLDVFVLAKGLSQKIVDKVFAHPQLVPWPASEEALAFLFEIDRERDRFMSMANVKFQAFLLREEEERKKEEQKKKKKKFTISPALMDKKLQQAIWTRRSVRDHAEILVVEDDDVTRRMVIQSLDLFFSHKDLHVVTAKDGQEALRKYALHAPNMIFLDIGLPDFNGHDIMKAILAMDPKAYIIMLSGHDSKENILHSMDQGAKGFVGKPFHKGKLAEYVHNCPSVLRRLQ